MPTDRVSVKPISRVRRDVVGHRKQLLVHQRLGARHDAIALRVWTGEPGHEPLDVERTLQIGHFPDYRARGGFLGIGFLFGSGNGYQRAEKGERDEASHGRII